MTTNLAIDDNLILEVKKIGGHKTKKDTVTSALKKYIQRRKQMELVKLFSEIDYDKSYDYKTGRTRK